MTTKKPAIIIDTREKLPFSFGRRKTIVGTLKTGDYSLEGFEDKIVVERKSIKDFASSITKERFWNEMGRMQEIPHSYLLLEFSVEDIIKYPVGSGIPRKKWRWLKVKKGYMFSCIKKIEEDYGITVLFSDSRAEAAKKCKELLSSGVH